MHPFLKRFAVIYVKLVGGFVLLLAVMAATHIAMNFGRVFPDPEHILVYGTDTCGYTTAMRADLEAGGLAFEYADLDLVFPAFELAYHVGAESVTRPVRLPVVLVGGKVLERPAVTQVIGLAGE